MFSRVIRFFAAPRLALATIAAMIVYAVVAVGPPAAGFGRPFGDSPFVAAPFFALATLLFLGTASCTWLRAAAVIELWRGVLPVSAVELCAPRAIEIETFLREAGFRGDGSETHWRNRVAIGAGWLLHIGLLVLMVGVGIQLLWHDGGAFEVAVGESIRLSDEGIVFGRSAGPLAAAGPPRLGVTLAAYDPHLHQAGYAPDRSSRLRIEVDRSAAREVVVDRVKGVTVAGTTLFQAMPAGIALIVALPGNDVRAVHLQRVSDRRAEAEITDPAGEPVRVVVDSELDLDDRHGTGLLIVRLVEENRETVIGVGDGFLFGGVNATLLDVTRWSGFTYSRSPGMPAVFASFGLLLVACTLLAIPAGVACIEDRDEVVVARVWLSRGRGVLMADWRRLDIESRVGENAAVPMGAPRQAESTGEGD